MKMDKHNKFYGQNSMNGLTRKACVICLYAVTKELYIFK